MKTPLPPADTKELIFASFKRTLAVLDPPRRKAVLRQFFFMVVLAFLELGGILLLTFFFSSLGNSEAVKNAWYTQRLFAVFPSLGEYAADNRKFLLLLSLLPILFIVAKNICGYAVNRNMNRVGENIAAYIGRGIMHRFLYMPYQWHLSSGGAEAIARMSWRNSVGQALNCCLTIFSNTLTSIFLFSFLLWKFPETTLPVIIVLGLAATLTYILLRNAVDTSAAFVKQMKRQESRTTQAAVRGIREVLIYQQQQTFLDAIDEPVRAASQPKSFMSIASSIPSAVLESCGFALIGATIALLIYVQDAQLPAIVTTVALLAFTAWRVLPSLNRSVGAVVNLRSHAPAAFPCLEYFEEIQHSPTLGHVQPDPGFTFSDNIHLKDVTFRYPEAEEDSLRGVTLHIPKGTALGLIGRSGAGKTTLINILSGLLEPTRGAFMLDGAPPAPPQLAAYRKQVGYVPQTPFLLAGTVAENVAFSEWGKPYDVDRVKQACREAAIDFLGPDFEQIKRRVKEGGAGFSGGQAQRISIARALYPSPSVLIFDEATSSLDQAGEAAIQESIQNLRGRVTCIIAAHRLSTLQMCDLILWLEDGKVKETGTPTTVLPKYESMLLNKDSHDTDI